MTDMTLVTWDTEAMQITEEPEGFSTYQWHDWADGVWRLATAGDDYDDAGRFISAGRTWARRKGYSWNSARVALGVKFRLAKREGADGLVLLPEDQAAEQLPDDATHTEVIATTRQGKAAAATALAAVAYTHRTSCRCPGIPYPHSPHACALLAAQAARYRLLHPAPLPVRVPAASGRTA